MNFISHSFTIFTLTICFFPTPFSLTTLYSFIPQEGLVSSFTSYVQMILCVYINLGVKNELTHDICLSKSHLFHLI